MNNDSGLYQVKANNIRWWSICKFKRRGTKRPWLRDWRESREYREWDIASLERIYPSPYHTPWRVEVWKFEVLRYELWVCSLESKVWSLESGVWIPTESSGLSAIRSMKPSSSSLPRASSLLLYFRWWCRTWWRILIMAERDWWWKWTWTWTWTWSWTETETGTGTGTCGGLVDWWIGGLVRDEE